MSECLLTILQDACGWLTAVQLANRIYLLEECSKETRRREIRRLVRILRKEGHWIIGDIKLGYLLTDNFKAWMQYQEGNRWKALKILSDESLRKKELEQANQLSLFRT